MQILASSQHGQVNQACAYTAAALGHGHFDEGDADDLPGFLSLDLGLLPVLLATSV